MIAREDDDDRFRIFEIVERDLLAIGRRDVLEIGGGVAHLEFRGPRDQREDRDKTNRQQLFTNSIER